MELRRLQEDIFLNNHIFKNKLHGVYIELGALDGIMVAIVVML